MRRRNISYITFILIFSFEISAYGQACCTAGTPLLGSLQMTTAPKGNLQFGLTIEHNALTHVLSGTNKLRNEERERISESVLLEINYGLTNRLSITGLFSFIRQKRTIFTFDNSENILQASGLGDIAFIAKYSLIPFDIIKNEEFSIGVGIKIPFGNSALKNDGILIPADMQPGSGSWDGIIWTYYSKGNVLTPSLTFLANLSYRYNGGNDRFEQSKLGYSFGNELIGSLGFSYSIISYLDLSLLAKYRNSSEDSFNKNGIPNTGGNWLYLIPSTSYYISDRISTRIEVELPIYRNVKGTQLTTTYTASISLFYTINTSEGSL